MTNLRLTFQVSTRMNQWLVLTKSVTLYRYTVLLAAAQFIVAGPLMAATSVTRDGITWTFAEDHQVGQFANGDWWVVGPVTIVDVEPKDTDGVEPHMHGGMINPVNAGGAQQGFDSRIPNNTYDQNLNVANSLPFTVATGSSLVQSKSNPIDQKPHLEVAAILTVLESPAPTGSFRPPYHGSDKTIRWSVNDIDYSKLRNLSPVPGLPTLEDVQSRWQRTLIQTTSLYVSSDLHPYLNSPFSGQGYGREITRAGSEAALMLNVSASLADKQSIAIGFLQAGIDIYGSVTLGGIEYRGNGGHHGGRKLPMMVAGLLLNDGDILAAGNGATYPTRFAEDDQHFYVAQADVDLERGPVCCDRTPLGAYAQSMIGMPEWAHNHNSAPQQADSNWSAAYRTVVGGDTVGNALAAHLMGLEEAWGNQAFFDYYETRYFPTESSNAGDWANSIKVFVKNMWLSYWGEGPVDEVVVPRSPSLTNIF